MLRMICSTLRFVIIHESEMSQYSVERRSGWTVASSAYSLMVIPLSVSVGAIAGQEEKHIVERGAAHVDAFDLDLRVFQALQDMFERCGAVARRDGQDTLLDNRLQLVPVDGLLRPHEIAGRRDGQIDVFCADARLERIRVTFRDNPALVDDRDPVGKLI